MIYRSIDIKIKLTIFPCDSPNDIRYQTDYSNYHIEQTKPEFDTSLVIWRDRAETLIYKSIERRIKERFPYVSHGTYCYKLDSEEPIVQETEILEKIEVKLPVEEVKPAEEVEVEEVEEIEEAEEIKEIKEVEEITPPVEVTIPIDVQRRLDRLEGLLREAEATKGPYWEKEVAAYERAIKTVKEIHGIKE